MRKTASQRQWESDLASIGLTPAGLKAVQAEYAAAGLSLARVDGRGWRVFGVHPTAAQTFTIWGRLAELVANRVGICERFAGMVAV